MSGSVGGEIKAEPNLTPLLDVVFQLITFFMLVINFSNDTYDQRVRLPVAGSARPADGTQAARTASSSTSIKDGKLLWTAKSWTPRAAIKEIEHAGQLTAEAQRRAAPRRRATIEQTCRPRWSSAATGTRNSPWSTDTSPPARLNGFRKFALKAMTD